MRSVIRYLWKKESPPKLNKIISVYTGWTKKDFVVVFLGIKKDFNTLVYFSSSRSCLVPPQLINSLCFTINMERMGECMYMHVVTSRHPLVSLLEIYCKGRSNEPLALPLKTNYVSLMN